MWPVPGHAPPLPRRKGGPKNPLCEHHHKGRRGRAEEGGARVVAEPCSATRAHLPRETLPEEGRHLLPDEPHRPVALNSPTPETSCPGAGRGEGAVGALEGAAPGETTGTPEGTRGGSERGAYRLPLDPHAPLPLSNPMPADQTEIAYRLDHAGGGPEESV